MIKRLRLCYSVPFLCRVLNVSRSGYYSWFTRKPSRRSRESFRIKAEIWASHKRTRHTFGPERLQRDLAEHGIEVGIYCIRKLRKELGIRCKQVKRFKATTDSAHRHPVADNLVKHNIEITEPNKVWASDITYIFTEEGYLYLAGHKDLYTGEIVGYAMSDRITKELVSRSLFRAVTAKRPPGGLIHHSDRGSQYCSYDYRKLLNQFGMKASMSRRGNCYDNSSIESFWGTLKNELVYHNRYKTIQEAIDDVTEYIEIFYNRQRTQKRLGYLSPAAYAKRFYEKTLVA